MHTVTFDQMERSADRTLAIVLWAKHAKNWAITWLLFAVLNSHVRILVKKVSGERINSLSDAQAKELAQMLKDVTLQLGNFLDNNSMCVLRRKKAFTPVIAEIEKNTEELCDIIEDLLMSSNIEFRGLVADCVKSVSSAHSADLVGRM